MLPDSGLSFNKQITTQNTWYLIMTEGQLVLQTSVH